MGRRIFNSVGFGVVVIGAGGGEGGGGVGVRAGMEIEVDADAATGFVSGFLRGSLDVVGVGASSSKLSSLSMNFGGSLYCEYAVVCGAP